jgi:hypothetical protein
MQQNPLDRRCPMPLIMVAMKPRLVVLLLCASLFTAVQARAKDKIILPDACGDASVKFDVTTEKNQPAPATPAAGKAQIVFITTVTRIRGGCIGCDVTTRFGVDGAWAGANKNNSYFAFTVDPGKHHLCVDLQFPNKNAMISSVESFTAEPGGVYYFEAALNQLLLIRSKGPGPGESDSGGGYPGLKFSQLNEDEGKYRVKAWNLATWTTK